MHLAWLSVVSDILHQQREFLSFPSRRKPPSPDWTRERPCVCHEVWCVRVAIGLLGYAINAFPSHWY